MQAAGLLKDKNTGNFEEAKNGVKQVRPMAKPILVASVVQENSSTATLVEENKDGMGFTTTKIKLPNGKKAWNKKDGKRPRSRSNKVGDVNGSNEKDKPGVYKQTGVVNIVLYVGFFLIGVGLVLTFIGMGDRGFKTAELKAIGPSLIGCGVLFCMLRLVFCSFSPFKKKKKLDEKSLISSESIADTDSTTTGNGIPPLMKRPSAANTDPVGGSNTNITDDHQQHRITNQPPRPQTSTIPNFIEDEGENDQDLGLEVDYRDDNVVRRPWSASPSVESGKLPDITSPRSREVILDPSKLYEGPV